LAASAAANPKVMALDLRPASLLMFN